MKKFSFTIWAAVFFASFVFGQATNIKSNLSIFGGIEVNNRIVFAVGSGQLGITDASAAGTQSIDANKVLLDFNSLSAGLAGNKFFFTGINASNGSELWVTDGTDAGTKLVKDINPGNTGSGAEAPNGEGNFPFVNNHIFFIANDGVNGYQLWKSDGTEAGTKLVKIIRPGGGAQIRFPDLRDSNFYAANNFYFMADDGVHGIELWKTDGTEAGTMMVADITPGPSSTRFGSTFVSLCGTLIFSANNNSSGMELWKTNGTAASTMQLKDIAPGTKSGIRDEESSNLNCFTFRNKLYFTAYDGGADTWTNEQMWVTDGTPGGTSAVTNLNQMNNGFHASLGHNGGAVISGGRFYFLVNDFGQIPISLWVSDGSTAGTIIVKVINNVPPDWGNPNYQRPFSKVLMPFIGLSEDQVSQVLFKGNSFFMVADDGVHKRQLWVSDGTEAGTKMLLINPYGHGIDSSENYPEDFYFRITADHIYFSGVDASHGMELWRSDGTQAGTAMVFDARPGPSSSEPQMLGMANGKLTFHANDGTSPNLYAVDQQVYAFNSGRNVNLCPGGSTVLSSNVTGSEMVWQVKTPSGWTNLSDNANISGTHSPNLVLTNMPSSAYGWEFRCVADGVLYSNTYRLSFLAFWVGAVSNAWENPANWHCGVVPDGNTDVLIQCQFGNAPVINTDVQCRSIWMQSRQSLQVAPGAKLTVTYQND